MIGSAPLIGAELLNKGCLISFGVLESLNGFKGDMKSLLI